VGGVALASLGLLSLLYALVQGRELGWPAWTVAAMVGSIPLFAAFALYEGRVARAGGWPLVNMRLFRNRAFVAGLLVSLTLLAGMASFFLVYVLFVQVGLGFSALQTGLTALPWPVGVALAAGASVRLAPKVGRHLLSLGLLLMALGMAGLSLLINLAGLELSGWHMAPALLISGLGMGMVMPTLMDFILAGVPSHDAGAASGVVNTIMQVGSAAGVAVIGVIYFGLLESQPASAAASTLWVQVGLFVLAFGLAFLLPPPPVAHTA
jgi:predicted MFS family arabinose efflux permease